MNVIGVDLGGTRVRAGLVSGGLPERIASAASPASGSEGEVLEAVFAAIRDAAADRPIEAIGVGVPGVMDRRSGVVYDLVNIPSWKRVPLRAILESRFGVPVRVDNDANCFAVCEKVFGKAAPCDDAVGLIVGTGLGAGVIANGRLFSGAHCGAGEVGMLPYLDANFEAYASGQFFRNVHGTTGAEAARKAAAGDPAAAAMFAEFGGHLGQAIKALLYAFDPEMIVLGGSVSRSFPLFRDAVTAALSDYAYSIALRDLRIEVSDHLEGDYAGVLGAAALFGLDRS